MYDESFKKRLEILNFENQLNLYMSKKYEFENFDIFLSDYIEDNYWNFATAVKSSNIDEFEKDWQTIKEFMIKHNRIPAVHITGNSPMFNLNISSIGLKPITHDMWLIIDDLNKFPNYKSKLDIVTRRVDSKDAEQFINAVSVGFSSEDENDPYDLLPESYRISLRNSFNVNDDKYKIAHYTSKYNDIIVGTATANYCDDIAFIFNVTTTKGYKRQGICKEMMSYIVKDLEKVGIKYICLQTEKGFYTVDVYKSMGFKEIFEGITYTE